MESLKLAANYGLYYPWQMTVKLNGNLYGVFAIQKLATSILLASKTFYYQDAPTPRIDETLDFLKKAGLALSSVPFTIINAKTTLLSVQKMYHTGSPSSRRVCKNAFLAMGLFAKTIGLVQFIDTWGAGSIAAFTRWDAALLGGLAAKIGGSRLFALCKIDSLNTFRAYVTIGGILLAMVHAHMTYAKKSKQTNQQIEAKKNEYKMRLHTHRQTIHFFKLAGGVCKIACIAAAGSTTKAAVSLYLVSSVLMISNECFKIYRIGTPKQKNKNIPKFKNL